MIERDVSEGRVVPGNVPAGLRRSVAVASVPAGRLKEGLISDSDTDHRGRIPNISRITLRFNHDLRTRSDSDWTRLIRPLA